MDNTELDKLLRDKLESYTENVDESLWTNIAGRLDVRHRRRVIMRFALGSVAAAACLLLGIFLFNGDQSGNDLVAPTVVAVNSPVETAPEVSVQTEKAIPPMVEQIKAFAGRTAYVEKKDVPATEGEAAEDAPVEVIAVTADNVVADNSVAEKKAEKAVEPAEENKVVDSKYSSLGYWDEEPVAKAKTRNTSFTISSNVASVASEGGFMYNMAPSHSASTTGSIASSIEQVSGADYSMPLSFGLQVRYALSDRISVGTGISYTYLESTFDALVNKEAFKSTSSQLHYFGIPVNIYYDFARAKKVNFYATVGGAVEKCVKFRYVYGSNVLSDNVKGMQLSASLGVGLEYKFIPRLSVYFDPSVSYYFDNDQPLSIRTSQPFQMNFQLGFRFWL